MQITLGEAPMPSLDSTRLAPEEMAQVAKLLEERAKLQLQQKFLEQEIHVFLMAAKERRELLGPVTIDCLTGEIQPTSRDQEE